MKSSHILFREEYRPPRLLTWSVVLIGASAVVSAGFRELPGAQPGLFALIILGAALSGIILLEFIALVIEVSELEVCFSVTPFYRRRMVIADIKHRAVKTYPSPANSNARYSWRPPKHGVELTMKDGSTFTLMSAHAEKLSAAIEAAGQMVADR